MAAARGDRRDRRRRRAARGLHHPVASFNRDVRRAVADAVAQEARAQRAPAPAGGEFGYAAPTPTELRAAGRDAGRTGR